MMGRRKRSIPCFNVDSEKQEQWNRIKDMDEFDLLDAPTVTFSNVWDIVDDKVNLRNIMKVLFVEECEAWATSEDEDDFNFDDLPSVPCNIGQARNDLRFYQVMSKTFYLSEAHYSTSHQILECGPIF